ncbi:MAG: zinc-dependent alcohol dehydrogenase family protein [Flavobacteriaceae bacterium]|nr:zinc-dependent alcohol dehydrogenase family protein [Bacteroidia bacterium]MBT8287212.1 zinc-dependent alcohol dehydrogenase family protein [Bacteroidia bacterium]NNF75570.1 zinc-dependent alcohol dehydrogenase family protein [Flavobacteriaceae bacterium]NNK74377.1 zinc-dependent alcohol dehydrogenase family protein [Flavobacteriaceae bacterium]
MRAALYESFQGPITIQQLPDPKPDPNGVILEVLATGMCRSDWHGWMGHDPDIKLPHVPGHEIAGRVVEVGKFVKLFKVDDRVTLPFVCGCGTCPQCHSGNHQVCDHQSQPGFTHWGSFAELVRIDYADINLVKLPDHIDNVTAASLGCRFITAFRAVVDQGGIKAGETVAVHGCGGVGLSAIMIAKAKGAQVVAIDVNSRTLELAKELGADFCVNSSKTKLVVDAVKDLTVGGVALSIDALGSSETAMNSINSLAKRGKHIQVGLMTGDHRNLAVPMDKILAHELEIKGSHGMQAFRYTEVFKLIEQGLLTPGRLINETINLDQAVEILPRMNTSDHSGILVINSF